MTALLSGLDRWEEAVEKIGQRVRRFATILDRHHIPYQVVGGLAVAEWVESANLGGVRATRDVDVAIRANDLPRIRMVLEEAGYRYKETLGLRMLFEPGTELARDAIHVWFAGEKVREQDLHPVPLISDDPPRPSGEYAVIGLASLVQMKLTSFRLKDKVHVLDMLAVGLITPEVESTLPADLLARLKELKDNPDA